MLASRPFFVLVLLVAIGGLAAILYYAFSASQSSYLKNLQQTQGMLRAAVAPAPSADTTTSASPGALPTLSSAEINCAAGQSPVGLCVSNPHAACYWYCY